MDLSKGRFNLTEKSEAGVVYQVLDPGTNKPLIDDKTEKPVTLTLIGRDSEAYRRTARQLNQARLNAVARAGSIRRVKIDAEELEADGKKLLAACIIGWANIELDGEPLPYSFDNALRLLEAAPWLETQVDDFVGDRSNFLGN